MVRLSVKLVAAVTLVWFGTRAFVEFGEKSPLRDHFAGSITQVKALVGFNPDPYLAIGLLFLAVLLVESFVCLVNVVYRKLFTRKVMELPAVTQMELVKEFLDNTELRDVIRAASMQDLQVMIADDKTRAALRRLLQPLVTEIIKKSGTKAKPAESQV